MNQADIVICGAGIAGVSAAYHLAVKFGWRNILLLDENAPLSLTSDHSTECYRNWWPGPGEAMVALMNRSIDLLEALADESNNVFHLNRRGYLYCTSEPAKITSLRQEAQAISALGAGPLRLHTPIEAAPAYQPAPAEGYRDQPTGADLLLDPALIRAHFPYLSEQIIAALHVRRAGWFSAQQLGMYMLQQARAHGVQLLRSRLNTVDLVNGGVGALRLEDGSRIQTSKLVLAPGPMLKQVGEMIGLDLPVFNELHLKVAIKDTQGILDRAAPLVIYSDAQTLAWNADERQFLDDEAELTWLLGEMPPGVHTRPEGGPDSPIILILWEYHTRHMQPTWPIPLDENYPEIALRGLVRLIPSMQAYIQRLPQPRLDGGYYTRTRENRPLIGKTPVSGAYLIGALSGFGVMAACAAGELLAAHVSEAELPSYAPAFALERYQDPDYQRLLETFGDSGQL